MAKERVIRNRAKRKNSANHVSKVPDSASGNQLTRNEHSNAETGDAPKLSKYIIFASAILICGVCWMVDRDYLMFSADVFRNRTYLSRGQEKAEQDLCRYEDEFTIDRRSNLSLEEFVRCYDAKRPVIITDVMSDWKAMHWNKSFLVDNYGNKRVSMKATEGPLRAAKGFAVPLKMFAEHAHEGKPQLWTYLEDELFIEMNPTLKDSIGHPVYLKEDFFQLLPKSLRPWNAMLLWGTAHSRSSLHIDPYNWTGTNAVLSGRKMWKIYPPGQDDLLYVVRNQRCGFPLDCLKYNSPVDAFDPDYNEYPKFRQAKAISFTQKPGELFVIPTGWFHQAYNPVQTMAISSQVMNSQNYRLVLEEIYKAGEIHPKNLPSDFHSLSPSQQVEAVVKIIPKKLVEKGKKVTEDMIKQLKWDGKGKPKR